MEFDDSPQLRPHTIADRDIPRPGSELTPHDDEIGSDEHEEITPRVTTDDAQKTQEKSRPHEPVVGSDPEATSTVDLTPQPKTQEVAEREPSPPSEQLVRVDTLLRTRAADGSQTVQNQANIRRVVDTAQQGKDQVFVATIDGASRASTFDMSESLAPRTHEKPRPADESAEDTSRFVAWARIRAEHRPPDPKEAPPSKSQEPSPEGFNIEGLLPHIDGSDSVQIVMQADAIDPALQTELMERVSDELHDATQIPGRTQEALTLMGLQSRLGEAVRSDDALVGRTVVIGVEDPTRLDEIARAAAHYGFVSNSTTSWSVETGPDGRVVSYPDAETAQSAGRQDLEGLIPASQFGRETQLPTHEIPGVRIEDEAHFPANRYIEPGTPTFSSGYIIHNGKPGSPLETPLEDLSRHTLILGGSGAGKTVLLETNIVEAAVAVYRQQQKEGKPAPFSVIILDFQKIGNWGQALADRGIAAGLPEEWTDVRCMTPGAPGLRVNIDPFAMVGNNTVKEQIDSAVRNYSAHVVGEETAFLFKKYFGAASKLAYEDCGWDVEANCSAYPDRIPSTPTRQMVRARIRDAVKMLGFQDKTENDLIAFVTATEEIAGSGIQGEVTSGGYRINHNALLDRSGTKVLQLGNISSSEAKANIMSTVFDGIVATLKARHPDGDESGIPEVMIVMDEATPSFKAGSPTGEYNANVLTYIRGLKAAVVVATQSTQGLAPQIETNATNRYAMMTPSPVDRTKANDLVGNTISPGYLLTVPQGGGLYMGAKMPEPLPFRTPNPETTPREEGAGRVLDGSDLVHQGTDTKLYPGEVHVAAQTFLDKTDVGRTVRGLSEINATLVLNRRDTAKIEGELRASLQAMTGEQALARDCAIEKVVANAVNSRPAVMNEMDREDLIRFLRDDLLSQVRNETPPERPTTGLHLNIGHYSPVKDVVTDAMIARRVDEPWITDALDRPVRGRTAQDQLENVTRMADNSVAIIANAVQETITPQVVQQIGREVQKIAGQNPGASVMPDLYTRLEKALDRPLTPSEQQVLGDAAATVSGGTAGYDDVRQALETRIKEAKHSVAVDLGNYTDLYPGETFEGQTAAEQLQNIEAKERDHLARSSYRVENSDVLFAKDREHPGHTLDNVVGSFVQQSLDQGIYAEQRQVLQGGKEVSYALAAMLSRNDPATDTWKSLIGVRLLRSGNVAMPEPVRQFLVRQIGEHIKKTAEQNSSYGAKQQTAAAS